MSKRERKISILDYLIILLIGLFFSIVYFYSSIIWPREQKFKNVDRSRMERIDNAQQLYYLLTNDYTEDGRILFSMMESIKDTLNGDSFFEGEKKVVLAKKNKRYIVNSLSDKADTVLVSESASKSFEFSEGVKLFSDYVFNAMSLDGLDLDKTKKQIQKSLIRNLIDYSTSKNKTLDAYSIEIGENKYLYSISEYSQFVEKNVYAISDVVYKSLIDDRLLTGSDLKDVTYTVNVPPGFKNRLDTTFTKSVKIEQFYEDSIYSVRVLNLDPTDNFIDTNNNGNKDEGENYYDVIYLNSKSLLSYAGEEFIDSNDNNSWDKGESYKDLDKNGKYNPPKDSYLGIIPNQDVIYSVSVDGSDDILHLPNYKYEKYLKNNKITDENIIGKRDVDFKVVSRKKINMDYFSNADTLTLDSLYSSINFFRHGYDQKDLFEINIVRFENESYKLRPVNGLDSDLLDEFQLLRYLDSLNEIKRNTDKDGYQFENVLVSLPFIANPIAATFYYEKIDPPNIEIISPVNSDENWTYWQKINLVSINDLEKSDHSINSFSLPTPFSFYSGGSKDKVVEHIKSWVD